uniref:Uncharacterized protein n=1 Tax=Arundo donax TaxID=35708 RepID=A0A0A9H7T8_ARUDO
MPVEVLCICSICHTSLNPSILLPQL